MTRGTILVLSTVFPTRYQEESRQKDAEEVEEREDQPKEQPGEDREEGSEYDPEDQVRTTDGNIGINAMTEEERDDPDDFNGERRTRWGEPNL